MSIAIVCVDDEEIILSSIGEQLKRNIGRNYNIKLASSGEEALTLCAELTAEGIDIAVIISDQTMPNMLGDELLVILHAYYPKALKILLTGRAGVSSIGSIVNADALYRYISKPWSETDLILTVKEALRRYGQEEQLLKQNNLLMQTNKKLSKSLNLLLAVFKTADDGILVLDNQDEVIIYNQLFTSLWQIDAASIEGNSDHILGLILRRLAEPIACNLKNTAQASSAKHHLLKLNNGKILESYFQTQKLNGKVVGKVWGFRDVTERERVKKISKHKALHDTLTELPKRSVFTCQLTEAIAKAKQNNNLVAVMFVELDRFKIVSDTFGHKIGDCLLQQVVQRLKDYIQEEIIARWGNEFTLLSPHIQDKQEITAIAQKVLSALKTPFRIDNKPIHVNSHIGIAVYPEHGTDAETILKNADAALSEAQKLRQNSYVYYSPKITSQAQKLLVLENLLHSALKQNEFLLYYQPIVNIVTGKIVKMEALIRWRNPKLGLVAPDVFIPLAEENGTIISIGEWVLKTACA